MSPASARVDLLFELGFVYDREDLDFHWLDRALRDGGFEPIDGVAGWQWMGVLGDAHVRLDLLCDVYDSSGQPISLPGAEMATVQNLAGPAPALHQPITREIDVPATVRGELPGAAPTVSLKFASLGGYIAAKAAAFLSRGQGKDAYD